MHNLHYNIYNNLIHLVIHITNTSSIQTKISDQIRPTKDQCPLEGGITVAVGGSQLIKHTKSVTSLVLKKKKNHYYSLRFSMKSAD